MTILDKIIDYAYEGWGEDRFFIKDSMAGVIDAATPIDKRELFGYHSQAEWLAEQMSEFMIEINCDAEYPQLCREFVDAYMVEMVKKYQMGIDNMPSATTAVVQECNEYIKGYVLGDCEIDVLLKDDSIAAYTDTRVEPFGNKTFERKRQAISRGEDEKEAIKDQMRENRKSMNEPGGYWVVAAKNSFEKEFISFSYKKEDMQAILLYSDGFARIFKSSDITKKDVLTGNISLLDCVARQRSIENSIDYVKKSDDISAILLTL